MESKLNPRTRHMEFSGVPGALAITFGLPLLINAFALVCNDRSCTVQSIGLDRIRLELAERKFLSWEAAYAYAAWFFSLVLLDRIVPGKSVQGTKLRDGSHLQYSFNGTIVVVILFTTLAARAIQTQFALPELQFVYDHLLEIANVAIVSSFILALYVYIVSFLHKKEPILAEGGNTGNPIYDWFIGRELNPRIGSFDIKLFCEMRPGLLLWVVINLAMLHHQWLKYGTVSDSMVLVCMFQVYYVVEGTFYETGLISMMDITTDGFGYMLSFGDLALVPFTYTLQSRFLADHPVDLGAIGVAGVLAVYFTGLLIFRLSNNEKNKFKQGHPSTKHLKYIQSASGSRLITSGWWGAARHINYFGDWLIAWAFCLPTGFSTPITYYFVIFFGVLLIHRETRDEAKCAAKYGPTWVEYKKLVPSRIIPGIY